MAGRGEPRTPLGQHLGALFGGDDDGHGRNSGFEDLRKCAPPRRARCAVLCRRLDCAARSGRSRQPHRPRSVDWGWEARIVQLDREEPRYSRRFSVKPRRCRSGRHRCGSESGVATALRHRAQGRRLDGEGKGANRAGAIAGGHSCDSRQSWPWGPVLAQRVRPISPQMA